MRSNVSTYVSFVTCADEPLYTADTALQAEDSLSKTKDAYADAMTSHKAYTETSLADFLRLYRLLHPQSRRPVQHGGTERGEGHAGEFAPAAGYNVGSHRSSGKKWPDEQLKHEERQRREDVADLYAQLRKSQPETRDLSVYRRSMQAIQNLFLRGKTAKHPGKTMMPKHKHDLAHA